MYGAAVLCFGLFKSFPRRRPGARFPVPPSSRGTASRSTGGARGATRSRLGALAIALAGSGLGAAPAAAEELVVRLTPAGLDRVEQIVARLAPPSIALPEYQGQLQLPGGGTVRGTLRQPTLGVALKELELTPVDGSLRAHAALDLQGTVLVDIQGRTCALSLAPAPVVIDADLALGTAGGAVEVPGADLDIALAPEDVRITTADCAVVGWPTEWLIHVGRGLVVPYLRERLATRVAERLVQRVRGAIAGLPGRPIERRGLRIEVQPERVEVSAAGGLTIGAGVGVRWAESQPLHGETRGERSPPVAAPALGDRLEGGLATAPVILAVSDVLLGELLAEAWRGGLLERILAERLAARDLPGDTLAARLGLSPGTRISPTVSLPSAPRVQFGRGAAAATVEIPELRVVLEIAPPDGPASQLELHTAVMLEVAPQVDAATGALVLVPVAVRPGQLVISTAASRVEADRERLQTFVTGRVVPALAERLAAAPLVPVVAPREGIHAWLGAVELGGGWLRAALELHVAPAVDTAAPDTRWTAEPPVLAAASGIALQVGGGDAETPAPLLRYHVTVDGTPVTEQPQAGPVVRIPAAAGEHLVEVAAVDLHGNRDATPLRQRITVDDQVPQLHVDGAPASLLPEPRLRLRWRVEDDHAGAGVRWRLLRVMQAGDPAGELVSEGEGDGSGEIDVAGLDPHCLYKVSIEARDAAGNLTTREYGFGVRAAGDGCAVTPGRSGAGWGLVLLALAALLLLRRRGRSAPLGVLGVTLGLLLASGPARAQGVGSHLSGPTDADGASAFWNPAAMLRGTGTRFELGSGLSLIRVRYEMAETGDRSQTFYPKPEPTVGAYSDLLGPRWRIGFTVGVPQIDGAAWSRDGEAAHVTRYYAVKARNFRLTATPALAYRPTSWLALGAGVDFVYGRLDADLDRDMGGQINLALGSTDPDSPFPYGDPALAAPVDLHAAGWGMGGVAGLLVNPRRWLTFGASVHAPTKVRATGTVDLSYPESVTALASSALPTGRLPPIGGDVEVELELPLMAFAAVAVEPTPAWELRADYRFADRSALDTTDVVVTETDSSFLRDTAIVRGYRDRHSFGLRGLHHLARGSFGLRARLETNGIPDEYATPANLDFTKLELGAAVHWQLGERLGLTGHYAHFELLERQGASHFGPMGHRALDAYNRPSAAGTYRGVSDYLLLFLSMRL